MLRYPKKATPSRLSRVWVISVAFAALMSLLPAESRAAPLGGQVAGGSASISAKGLVTTITQSSDRAVIDWASFNLSQTRPQNSSYQTQTRQP